MLGGTSGPPSTWGSSLPVLYPFPSAATIQLYLSPVPLTWDCEGSVGLLQDAAGEAGNAAAASGD